jgi:hypothetical protein
VATPVERAAFNPPDRLCTMGPKIGGTVRLSKRRNRTGARAPPNGHPGSAGSRTRENARPASLQAPLRLAWVVAATKRDGTPPTAYRQGVHPGPAGNRDARESKAAVAGGLHGCGEPDYPEVSAAPRWDALREEASAMAPGPAVGAPARSALIQGKVRSVPASACSGWPCGWYRPASLFEITQGPAPAETYSQAMDSQPQRDPNTAPRTRALCADGTKKTNAEAVAAAANLG